MAPPIGFEKNKIRLTIFSNYFWNVAGLWRDVDHRSWVIFRKINYTILNELPDRTIMNSNGQLIIHKDCIMNNTLWQEQYD